VREARVFIGENALLTVLARVRIALLPRLSDTCLATCSTAPVDRRARRNPERVKEVLDTMIGLAEDGMTVLCLTLETRFAGSVADRFILAAGGRIAEQAPPRPFFDNPQHEKARNFLDPILSSHHAHH
jgi:hypothetical protein